MTCPWLDDERGVREELGDLAQGSRRGSNVPLSGEQQYWCAERGQCLASRDRVVRPVRAIDRRGLIVATVAACLLMRASGRVPPAVGERCDGGPVLLCAVSGRDLLERR